MSYPRARIVLWLTLVILPILAVGLSCAAPARAVAAHSVFGDDPAAAQRPSLPTDRLIRPNLRSREEFGGRSYEEAKVARKPRPPADACADDLAKARDEVAKAARERDSAQAAEKSCKANAAKAEGGAAPAGGEGSRDQKPSAPALGAAGAPSSPSAADILGALVLAGVMGMVGQTARTAVGLKKMNDDARANNMSSRDLFVASRLVMSMIIGFAAGVVAAFSLDLTKLIAVDESNLQLLLGIAAAGYAGTDFIEAFAQKIGGTSPPSNLPADPSTPGPVVRKTNAGDGRRVPAGRTTAAGRLAQNQLEAFEAARGEGLSDQAALALVANMSGESLADPANIHWDIRHNSQGIVQWDDNRAERIRRHFGRYPREMSVADQTRAAIWEIRTFNEYAKSRAALESGASAADIIAVLVANFERPLHTQASINQRVGILRQVAEAVRASDVAVA